MAEVFKTSALTYENTHDTVLIETVNVERRNSLARTHHSSCGL